MEKRLRMEMQKENFISKKINCHQFGVFIGNLKAGRRDKRDTKKRGLEKEKNYDIRSLWYQ